MGYTKLFSSIVASSIWQEDAETKVVWITMLALKDERHMVEASVSGLATISGVPKEKVEDAIRKFENPDPDSRSREFDGRKVERREGGWFILNGESYARKMSADERREYQRIKQAEYRKRKKDAACEGARQAVDEGLAQMNSIGKLEESKGEGWTDPEVEVQETPAQRAEREYWERRRRVKTSG